MWNSPLLVNLKMSFRMLFKKLVFMLFRKRCLIFFKRSKVFAFKIHRRRVVELSLYGELLIWRLRWRPMKLAVPPDLYLVPAEKFENNESLVSGVGVLTNKSQQSAFLYSRSLVMSACRAWFWILWGWSLTMTTSSALRWPCCACPRCLLSPLSVSFSFSWCVCFP